MGLRTYRLPGTLPAARLSGGASGDGELEVAHSNRMVCRSGLGDDGLDDASNRRLKELRHLRPSPHQYV